MAVVDAAYHIERSDDDWLAGVLDAALPVLDHGTFVHGWLVDLRAARFHCVSARLPAGADFERHVRNAHPDLAGARVDLALAPALMTASCAYPPGEIARRAGFPDGFGLRDATALMAADPAGVACLLSGGMTELGHVAPRDQAKWALVASHLAAALRLRDRIRAAPETAPLETADALFDPHGQVVHLTSEVEGHEAAVRQAATLLATRHGEGDLARRLAAWQALVAGRWSLVDTFDTDEKRFFVLRKNAPAAAGPPPLSPFESALVAYVAMGHSQKLIAYHLGLSESRTARLLAAICRKVGVRSKAELAQLAAALRAEEMAPR